MSALKNSTPPWRFTKSCQWLSPTISLSKSRNVDMIDYPELHFGWLVVKLCSHTM